MKTRFLLLVAVVLLLVPFGVGAQDQTVVDVIAGNADLSTLAGLIETAGLAETLSGEGPFTVFAPTNAAFEALPAPVVAYLTSEAGQDTLTAVLTYHVVPASVLAAAVTTGDVASVAGDAISLEVTDAGVKVENAVVATPDLAASNGVVHVIDAVILPDVELPAVDPLTVEGDVVTAGSSTVYPVSEAMAARFTEEGYAGNVTVDSIGSGAGFERFCVNGETDIANASRGIKQEEIDACAALTPARTPIEFRVGTDALAIVVSAENDFVEDVTKEELAAIFSTAQNWSDVRAEWPAEPILRFIPGTDSGTFDYFVEVILAKDEAPILAASNLQLSEDDNVLVQGVESSPYAVGFFGYAYYGAQAEKLHAVAVDGVAPSTATVDAATYPLARPLFLYSDATILTEKPQVASFVNYYLTNATEEVVAVGYFAAPAAALNLAKLELLIATAQ